MRKHISFPFIALIVTTIYAQTPMLTNSVPPSPMPAMPDYTDNELPRPPGQPDYDTGTYATPGPYRDKASVPEPEVKTYRWEKKNDPRNKINNRVGPTPPTSENPIRSMGPEKSGSGY